MDHDKYIKYQFTSEKELCIAKSFQNRILDSIRKNHIFGFLFELYHSLKYFHLRFFTFL